MNTCQGTTNIMKNQKQVHFKVISFQIAADHLVILYNKMTFILVTPVAVRKVVILMEYPTKKENHSIFSALKMPEAFREGSFRTMQI